MYSSEFETYLIGNVSLIGATIVCLSQCTVHAFIWARTVVSCNTFGPYITYYMFPQVDFWKVPVHLQTLYFGFFGQFNVFLEVINRSRYQSDGPEPGSALNPHLQKVIEFEELALDHRECAFHVNI